jgi:hypothetical protein
VRRRESGGWQSSNLQHTEREREGEREKERERTRERERQDIGKRETEMRQARGPLIKAGNWSRRTRSPAVLATASLLD